MGKNNNATYLQLCTEFYDRAHHPNEAQALEFYMQHAQTAQGKILEPMCGSGRFLIPMLQAGLDAEGFDASHAMVDSFHTKYEKISQGAAPVWQAYVQDFHKETFYNLIFIPYGSWGLLTNLDEAQQGLQNLYNHLAPNGKLIIEIETVSSVPPGCGTWQRGEQHSPDGSKIVLNFIPTYQEQTQLFQSRSRYEKIVNNQVIAYEEEIFQQYLYQENEFDISLRKVGFTTITKYPAFDATKNAHPTTPIIIYECLKK